MEKYRAGKEGIAEVSNALRQLAAARVRQSDIQTRYLVSMANLAYAVGTLMPTMENSPCE
jgi:outer membrane protein TolC